MAFFGEFNFGPGFFVVLIFGSIRSFLSLKSGVKSPGTEMIGFFPHTNPYLLNVMQQCQCLYFELGLLVIPRGAYSRELWIGVCREGS